MTVYTDVVTDSRRFSSKHWIHPRCAVPRHNSCKVVNSENNC